MSTEVMKQALEALETEQALRHGYSYLGGVRIVSTADEAINALRTAIQQAESEPVGEPRARVELIKTGGNAGLSTRIIELDIATRERLRPGDLLYTHPAPGVPVGQAPSVWNSIQIASWIGSQLMREPSMFERNAVCKFVRSLGRHPTLLKHSPKDTHPAPGVPEDVARDAISTVREQYRGTDWGKAAECICDAIDTAMLAAAQAQKGQQ